jgi:hypothetical protein
LTKKQQNGRVILIQKITRPILKEIEEGDDYFKGAEYSIQF